MHVRGVRRWLIGLAVSAGLGCASISHAANETAPMMQYLGYTKLWQTYGAALADGSNVSVALDEANGYPVLNDGRFADKTLTLTYTGTTSGDSHATNVGAKFFGNDTGFSQRSVAPHLGATAGGSSVQLYTASQFTGAYLLNPGSPAPYGSQNNARVASHAYSISDYSLSFITRLDYIQQRDDFMQVVGNNFYGSMGDSFNSIVVVSTDGAVNSGGSLVKTDAIGTGTPYTAGRVSPTVTGPYSGSPSDAIGQVAGIVGLLVSRGKTTSSNYSYTTATTTAVTAPYTGSNFSTFTKPGYTVTSGDTSEVVKAALMAGALRNVSTYTNGGVTVNGITNYRVGAANQTANGLDYRWGAGMANAYNSYQIINAGEQDSSEDKGSTSNVGFNGFDYDPHFGGANGSNNSATYFLRTNFTGTLTASLVWNVKINGGTTSFDPTATLYNLSLTLIDTADGSIVQQSASLVDNTQNLWTNVLGNHNYELLVGTTSPNFDWDYGLAWQFTPAPEPGSIALIGVGATLLLHRRRRQS